MKFLTTLAGAGAILMLTAATALAAPCATGTTTNAQGAKAADTSSNVDGGATGKVSPGAKAESPGTVGALNNTGANTQPGSGEKKPPAGKTIQGQNSDDC
ncbi:hypothetical protein [Methylobacterium planeticum]|uniref:Exopolysaccharide production protein YjbE n=1 Tax=Methylobacterium planeticum TaxID=2615211 RepID=A0A6N6MSI9_9HYPH|nr:hypothetical protein [Methylobacterium planeticum]KAB1071603.1 hypothetical protein F6X51_18725 [Methylobacterium planeticum]